MTQSDDRPEKSQGLRASLLRFLSPMGKAYYGNDAEDADAPLRMDRLDGVDAKDIVDGVELAKAPPPRAPDAPKVAQGVVHLQRVMAKDPLAGRVVLRTAEDVMQEWYETCVAHYAGACVTANELYDDIMGQTLSRFAEQHALDGVHITQADMEAFLDAKGIPHRNAMFKKRYDGIQHILYGNVRARSYST